MSIGGITINNSPKMLQNPNFRAQNIPAETNNPIEKLVQKVDEEKKKKHNKVAVAVGGSVLGLSLLVTLLNPRYSTKMIENLKKLQTKTNTQLEKSKGKLVKTKFYKFVSKVANWSSRFLSYTNNVNSVKDTYYKKLCTEDKTFYNIKNLERRKRFAKYDKVFRKIMQKPHELITKWGDALAKRTVRGSYKKAGKTMDSLEYLISEYANKLPEKERLEITQKLSQIKHNRTYFSAENINARLSNQEKIMGDLNSKIRRFWNQYTHGFVNKHINKSEHFSQNLSFWAQDMMQPARENLEKEGKNIVESLVGCEGSLNGEYGKLVEKLSKNLSQEEKHSLEKALKKTRKSLNNANETECIEYFDKKRDLILGSAPTDILTGAISLAVGGISLASANDKDKRISRLITGILPVIAGFGTNIILTSMLFSGTKGILYGIGASGILSLIGSKIDKQRLAAKNKLPDDEAEF